MQERRQGRSESQPVRVILVHDHPLLASAMARILDSQSDLTVCGIARNGGDAAPLAVHVKADVVVLDFRLPDMSGPAAAGMILAAIPSAAIVFYSARESESDLLDAIDVGATAFLTQSAVADEIVDAVRGAARGEPLIPVALFVKAVARQKRIGSEAAERLKLVAQFTVRELEVLHLLADGVNTESMAQRLGIATHTVEWHMRHVIEKLHVNSRLQAVIVAAHKGLVEL